jgi:Cu/Ag efflux protein CusF
MKRLLTLVMTLGLALSFAYAHNGMEHVMGTIAGITGSSITVTTADGKSQTVLLNADTKYAKNDSAISLKDIKVGDHVVIHATRKNNVLTAATVKKYNHRILRVIGIQGRIGEIDIVG